MQTRELTQQEIGEFRSCAAAGAKLLNVDSVAKPELVIQAIENHVLKHHEKKSGFFAKLFGAKEDSIQLALALGALWGDQLVRKFGWNWTCAQSEGNDFYCVASADKSVAIFPTYFVKGCLDNPQVDCTILLAWNMLDKGAIPAMPAGGLQDLMSGIQRVVPR